MKRIGIYVIYDPRGRINPYIRYVIEELRKYVTRLIVVCNFDEICAGENHVRPYADELYLRENIGYDAGAYKEVIGRLRESGKLKNYDELLVSNDSYFAPIYPFDEMFARMDATICDYWGIIRNEGGEFGGYRFGSHIQSFFMVFRRSVIEDDSFGDFWNNLAYPESFYRAVGEFEIGLNTCLERKGYIGRAYTDIRNKTYIQKWNENPYCMYSLEMIRDMRLPILKKKSLWLGNWGVPNALTALHYIAENTNYDVALIDEYFLEISDSAGDLAVYDYRELEYFVKQYAPVWFYGNGHLGEGLAAYFAYRGWDFAGYVVTGVGEQTNCKNFSDVDITEKTGVIIAVLDKKIADSIKEYVLTRCTMQQILTPRGV